MASAAEQLAQNMNFSAFAKASELQKRILFTLGALVVYRLGTYIPLPGIDAAAFQQAFNNASAGILGVFNAFSGGAVERMAIFALNVMPYITASIIMQIMAVSIPSLEKLKKEGETGRKQINQYTRYLTVFLATFQAYSISVGLEAGGLVNDPGWYFRISATLTLVSGTMFLMWLGEQITARGVGNGISLIIFAGIVADMPRMVAQLFVQAKTGNMSPLVFLLIIAGAVGLILFIVFMERSQRRLLIQYPKRQVGNRMFGGESSFLPLKLNTAGVIPPIFASSVLLMPATLGGFAGQDAPELLQTTMAVLGRGQPAYLLLYSAMIIFFAFFYTSIVFNPEDTADNLRKYGGFLPGIRPGKRTAEYIDYVLTRLTLIGAVYLAFVCVIPEYLHSQGASIPFALGGTSILIVVSVTMDTVSQIQSHLLAHQYEGLIKRSKLRGRKR